MSTLAILDGFNNTISTLICKFEGQNWDIRTSSTKATQAYKGIF